MLLDDVGFGASSAFGGPCATPTAERLAADGLKYNRFHTTALCSPTRQALLTGRNHHSVGMGGITEIATSAPGYNSVRPNTAAPLAETLKLNGYSTAQFGKCHEVPVWETSPMGPFDAWPSGGGGFEHFYGFIGGETNQYAPALYDGTVPIEPDRTPGGGLPLHRGHDRPRDRLGAPAEGADARQAVLRLLRAGRHARPASRPDRSGRTSTRAASTTGWDALREETFARQKELGVIPPEAELTDRPEEIPAWDDMPDDLKPVLARQMEVYAGFLEHTDHHIGRLVDALEELEVLDDTLIYYIVGDNGASGEGTAAGHVQRDDLAQRGRRARDDRVHGVADRPVRHARGLQPLRGRLGARDGHAVPVDEAGRLALGRHPQRHDRALAQRVRRPRARSAPSSAT